MRKTIFFFVVMGFMSYTQLFADQILLKNGDRLTGTIVESDDENLSMRSELAGEITVRWADIKGISSNQPVYVTLKDARVIVGTVASADGKLDIQTREAGKVTVSRSVIQSIRSEEEQAAYQAEINRLRNPRLFDFWSGSIDAGLSMTRGNASTTNFDLGMNATRRTSIDKIGLYLTSIFSEQSTTIGRSLTTARALRGGGRYDHDLTRWLFAFGFSDFEHDKFQELNLRNVSGGGLGWHAIKAEKTLLNLFAGGAYDQEFFSTPVRRISERIGRISGPIDRRSGRFLRRSASFTSGSGRFTRRSWELVSGEELSHELSRSTYLRETLAFYPNLSESGEYRITFDSSIATRINKWLEWQVSFSDRYHSNPIPGIKSNDILLTTGLRITFGEGDGAAYNGIAYSGTGIQDGDTDASQPNANKKKTYQGQKRPVQGKMPRRGK